jgi:hypothetical protein
MIRENLHHDYERIYKLVVEHLKKENKSKKKIQPNYFLGKDNKILREIIYKVNNYRDTIP